jgi:hypothetical protein
MADLRNNVKLQLPDRYDGTRNALIIQGWIFQIEKYIDFYGLDPANHLKLVQTLLRGEAAIWWLAHEKEVTAGRMERIETWERFKTALKDEFEPKEFQYELRSQLNRLYQNKKTVAEYATAFRKIIIMLENASSSELIHHFIDHLNADIALNVIDKNPTTLADAITRAQQVEDNLRRYGGRKKEKGKQRDNGFGAFYQQQQAPDYMELDAVNIGGKGKGKQRQGNGFQKKLSQQQLQQHIKAGACFKCHQPGHTARFCTAQQGPSGGQQMNQMYQAYPAMPAMPNLSHKASRQRLQLSNINAETMTDQGNSSSQ